MMRSVAEGEFPGRRRVWLLAAGVVGLAGALGCGMLVAALWEPGQSGAERANVLALPVAIVSALLTGVSIWLGMKGLRSRLDLRQAVRDLCQAVRTQRQRFLDQALAVAWQARPARVRFTDPGPEVFAEPVEALLLRWQDLGGAEAGSIEDVAAFYQNEPTGRLVVLGAPGAGKTVLLSRLVLDLLDQIDGLPTGDLPTEVRVPVLLSLPACDLGEVQGASSDQLAHRLQEWINARLREDYELGVAHAAALMRAQRILPVLDGLDEMDSLTIGTGTVERPRALAVLRALNAGIRAPVVVACRHTEYRDISQAAIAPAAAPTILTDARHVMLRPLEKHDIIAYLTRRFHGRDGQLCPRWHPVAAALDREAPLLDVLANPWQLFLAVTAYTAHTSHPADLLSLSPERIEAHLLANLIPAVVERDDTAARYGWSAQDITRWLSAIAGHQHRTATERGTSETDIYLPELLCITESSYPRWIPLALSLTPYMGYMGVILVLFFTDVPVWPLLIPILGLAPAGYMVFDPRSTMERIDLGGLRTPTGRRRLRNALVDGLVGGLAFGLTSGLVGGLAFGLTSGLAVGLTGVLVFGLVFGLAGGLTGEVAAVSLASVLIRQCLAYTLAIGLVGGLAFGLAGGLVVGNGSMWLRYAIAVRAAARRGSLPKRPARFLDWCLHTGLMRMAGTAVQFRHRRLQQALTPPDIK